MTTEPGTLTPDWVEDETRCPCGEPAGPEFRYGLCDAHSRMVPPVALLRWGASIGRLHKRVAAAESALAEERRRALEEAARFTEGGVWVANVSPQFIAQRIRALADEPGNAARSDAPKGSNET